MAVVLKTTIRETVSKVRILPPPQTDLVYTLAMSDVLDLKNVRPGDESVAAVDFAVGQEGRASTDGAGHSEEAPNPDTIEALAEAALARAGLPTAAQWTAHHPLEGASRRRHYYYSGALVGFAALISVWQGNPAAFIVVLLGAGALELRQHFSKPVSVVVNGKGLEVDGQQYEHASFASFHIHRMPDDTLELSLKSDRRFLPNLRLPLGEQDPYELHAVLTQYIPEGTHKIPLADYYVRKPR